MSEEKKEVLLSVRHLKQFFPMGNKTKLKAVNDVSFDIYKGEVFGLVGESGCGKTTTGRTIIKLYSPTGGQISFKGQVISCGTRWNEKEIKWTKIRSKEAIKNLKSHLKEDLEEADPTQVEKIKEVYATKESEIKKHEEEVVAFQKERIKEHHFDEKYGVREYAQKEYLKVKEEYRGKEKEFLAKSPSFMEKVRFKIEKEMAFHAAKNEKITNKIQMIFQDPISSLNPRMTIREIIAEGLKIRGIHDKKLIDRKVIEVLNMVGLLPEHASRYPHEFSGGQRQRIGIARAIVMEPELIIADEPISALDVSIQAQVVNLLNDIRHQMGLSILFIAHDLSVVKYFSDRIGVMYFGRMVELASSKELFERPLHPYTKSLISAIPLPDPHYERERKRIAYNPALAHDYVTDKPRFQEVFPNHFVYCNQKEFKEYRKGYEENDGRRTD